MLKRLRGKIRLAQHYWQSEEFCEFSYFLIRQHVAVLHVPVITIGQRTVQITY